MNGTEQILDMLLSRNFSSEPTIFDDKSKIKTKLQKIIYLVVSSHATNIFEKN